jgi:hypothetical protein
VCSSDLIRPTGLLDPEIEVRPLDTQVDDLIGEIDERIKMGDRILVTTLTKRMAEELSKYLARLNIKVGYIHSEVKTLERVEILRNLRLGGIDVLIGVNLLREGLDLPEVSLVAIMDADKEGFLRSVTSLVQTIGRAARNDRGKVIMYADKMTKSMDINQLIKRLPEHPLVLMQNALGRKVSVDYYYLYGIIRIHNDLYNSYVFTFNSISEFVEFLPAIVFNDVAINWDGDYEVNFVESNFSDDYELLGNLTNQNWDELK